MPRIANCWKGVLLGVKTVQVEAYDHRSDNTLTNHFALCHGSPNKFGACQMQVSRIIFIYDAQIFCADIFPQDGYHAAVAICIHYTKIAGPKTFVVQRFYFIDTLVTEQTVKSCKDNSLLVYFVQQLYTNEMKHFSYKSAWMCYACKHSKHALKKDWRLKTTSYIYYIKKLIV